jgi:di/tricarboxylate transporter
MLAILLAVLFALARNYAGADVVLLGAAVVLVTLSGLSNRFPTPEQGVSAFGNEGLVTVAVLFVVAAGLTETGALRVITERVLGRPRTVPAAQLRLMLPVTGISAFLNNTPVVAMFIPIVTEWCRRIGISPSKLLIPLSYAAVLGGLCTLIGTSTNLVVHSLMLQARATDPAMPTLGMFTLTPVGVPVALAGCAFLALVSNRLLPARRSVASHMENPREYTIEMEVEPGSVIDGLTIEAAGLRHLPGLYLAAIERSGLRRVPVPPDEVLKGSDQLTFVGVVESVRDLQRVRGLVPSADQASRLDSPRHVRFLAEAVVSPTSPVVGHSIREDRFRSRYEAVVLAVHRNGERLEERIGDIVLKPGDTLLLETTRRFMRQHRNSRDFFLVSDVPDSQPLRHDRAWIALSTMLLMVLVTTFQDYTGVSMVHAALLAAMVMGLTRCLSAEQARRSVDWATLVSIGAALIIGRATQTTGLASAIAGALLTVLEPAGPIAVLAGVYGLTLLFTEIVTNNAAAALIFPIAHAASASLGVSFLPFAVVIAIAASAGFATPLGYQTHLMVYGAGGYRFSDYLRVGVPMDVLAMVITVTLVPLVYPLQ